MTYLSSVDLLPAQRADPLQLDASEKTTSDADTSAGDDEQRDKVEDKEEEGIVITSCGVVPGLHACLSVYRAER